MGVDYAKLDEATEGDGRRLREGLGIASDAFVLFYTAEFSPRKSQQVLIRAIRDLPKSVVLVLCGDGTKREECRALSRELGVSDRVLFSGQVENISIWYRMADACVSSSRSEGLQFNIMEAMHLGLPVIASDVKGDADLIEDGNEVVICHGNGPQVGMIQNAMAELTRSDPKKYIPCPLSVCVAMSQGYIGYDLQNAMREEMLDRGIPIGAATVLTQVEVDPEDPAFSHPTKPIGPFMSEEEARALEKERDYHVMEDAGRGWRRVVASPEPKAIVEIDTIRSLVETDHVVVACGGGGIPVFRTEGHHLKGAAAVIDKDFAAAVLAKQLDADLLIILTAVEKVSIHFGKPDQQDLDILTPEQAKQYIAAGEFAPGSMLPKVEAALSFAESKPGRKSLITLLEKARDGINGKTGTIVVNS